MKRMEPTYDWRCWDLAEHFLSDETIPQEKREAVTTELAVHIQKSIEDWINAL